MSEAFVRYRCICVTHAQRLERRTAHRHLQHQAHATSHGYDAASVDPSSAVEIVFVDRNGEENKVAAPVGRNLLEVAHANNIDLEGACEGSLACSTCHVYLDQESFEKLEEPTDDENDMLDLAFGLAEK